MPRLWYCDHHVFPLPPGHKFPLTKYRLLREELSRDSRFQFSPSPAASTDDLCRVHDSGYVNAFLDGSIDPRVMRRIGFPWSEVLVARTLASVGGTVEAARDALRTGWGGNLAGGTHHAFASEGAGFCVFNDIAVAIRALDTGRAAVLDLDVHQGDGTALIFSGDPDTLTVSLHGSNNFPFRKQVSHIDVPLADGTGDDAFLEEIRRTLPRLREFGPRIVFYQSGVDGLSVDKLGRLSLTHAGLAERDRVVFNFCKEIGVACVITLGGGYADPITETVRAHAQTFRLAADLL